MAQFKARIDNLLKEKKVLVNSKTYCPFCVTAKVSGEIDYILPTYVSVKMDM
jgi:hypothetical protein